MPVSLPIRRTSWLLRRWATYTPFCPCQDLNLIQASPALAHHAGFEPAAYSRDRGARTQALSWCLMAVHPRSGWSHPPDSNRDYPASRTGDSANWSRMGCFPAKGGMEPPTGDAPVSDAYQASVLLLNEGGVLPTESGLVAERGFEPLNATF